MNKENKEEHILTDKEKEGVGRTMKHYCQICGSEQLVKTVSKEKYCYCKGYKYTGDDE